MTPTQLPLILRTVVTASLFSLASLFADEAPINWPIPVAAEGENPACVAAPRNEWMVKFATNYARARQGEVGILFQGDSITDWWKTTGAQVWAANYEKYHAASFGIAGDKTEHVLWRLKNGELGAIKPKLIVLMIGTNNIGRDPAPAIRDGIVAVVNEHRKLCPDAQILLLAVFPRGETRNNPARQRINAINELLAATKFDPKVSYLDIGKVFLEPDGSLSRSIMPDFLHPSPEGYERWAAAIDPFVTKVMNGK